MIDYEGIGAIIFHDLPVESLKLQFESKIVLELVVTPYDGELKNNLRRKLIFGEFEYCRIPDINLSQRFDVEIVSFDYAEDEGWLKGKFVFLTGFGLSSFEIVFKCKSLAIEDLSDSPQI